MKEIIRIAAALTAAAFCFTAGFAAEVRGGDFDKTVEYLSSLPGSADELAEEGIYVITADGEKRNADVWSGFVSSVSSGTSADVDIAVISEEGYAVIDHIEYDGSSFTDVRDNSRDHSYLGSAYVIRNYSCLLDFGSGWECAVLSSEKYESLAEVKSAIEEDAGPEETPVILYNVTG